MKTFISTLKKSLIVSIVLLVICGFAYPMILTGISQIIFNKQANGNLVMVNGEAAGSELVGQNFTDSRFFKSRISSVNYNTYTEEDLVADKDGNAAYGGVGSGSNNYAASNPALEERVKADIEKFLKNNPDVKKEDIPTDLLTSSGSGLDPHISPKSALIQIPAISEATGISEKELQKIVDNNTEGKLFGIFGENKVNVLKTNIEVAQAIGIL